MPARDVRGLRGVAETFPIVPSGSSTALTAAVLLVAPLFVGVAMARSAPAWAGGLILLTTFGASAALAFTVVGSRRARFEVSPEGLRLRGDFYGRRIPAARLRAAEVRAVDLRTDSVLRPTLRTFGTALPGYRAGWFRLRNRERALLYVTDPSRVAYVPTADGYAVLLSVPDPAAFVASLRRAVSSRA